MLKGFVDLQVNGYAGVNFSSPDLTREDCHRITDVLLETGTVAYCATVVSSELDLYRQVLPLLARVMDEPNVRGRMLGIHLEGPYISPADGARGAHTASRMRPADCDEFERLQEWADGRIALLTLAPEVPRALELIAHVRKRHPRTRVALGHHNAPRQTIHDAVAAGATMLTHLGNGCPAMLPRHENVIVHGLVHDGLSAGIITDGHHLPADMVRVIVRCKGPDRIFVVSDSTPLAGCPPGVYEMMGTKVRLDPSGRIENLGTAYLAGSAFGMAHCMRHLRSLGVLDDGDLSKVGFQNPLALLEVEIPDALLAPLPEFRFD